MATRKEVLWSCYWVVWRGVEGGVCLVVARNKLRLSARHRALSLRVEFLLQTESGYLRDAKVT